MLIFKIKIGYILGIQHDGDIYIYIFTTVIDAHFRIKKSETIFQNAIYLDQLLVTGQIVRMIIQKQ